MTILVEQNVEDGTERIQRWRLYEWEKQEIGKNEEKQM